MAMTKAERAEMDRLRQELAEAKALRLLGVPEPIKIQPPPPGASVYINGWTCSADNVSKAWTQSNSHGWEHRTDNGEWDACRPASQNGIGLYVTRLDALIGLRLAKERDCVRLLAKIDREIEGERAGGDPS